MTTPSTQTNPWSWLSLTGAAFIGLGWVVALWSVLSGEPTRLITWLMLVAVTVQLIGHRVQRTHPRVSTISLLAAAAVMTAAVTVYRQ